MFRATALAHMNSTALAVLCGEVAASHPEHALNHHIRATALNLMRAWNELLTPSMLTPQQTLLLESKRRSVRERMINFLVSI